MQGPNRSNQCVTLMCVPLTSSQPCVDRALLTRTRLWDLVQGYLQGYLAHKETASPLEDYHKALSTGPLPGPRRRHFLMSEEPLC